MNFDNQVISITGEEREDFDKAMSFFPKLDKLVGYLITGEHGLILYWTITHDMKITHFPYTMNEQALLNFCWGWLESNEAHALRGDEPDIDGDVGKAWKVYNEEWGHVNGEWQARVAIKPIWALYGK